MFTSLLNLFYPKVCVGCNELLLQGENEICLQCRHNIPLTNHNLLFDNEAYHKFYGRIPIISASAMMYYHKKGIVQQIIHKLKYKNQQNIGTVIGEWYANDLLENSLIIEANWLIPVPLHPRKYRERGYNQVTTFANALSNKLQIPVDAKLLVRNVYSKTQTKKNLFGRADISQELFQANWNETHHNNHFILVDDVITTGSTLESCCRALLKIPGSKISIVCMAISES